MLVLLLLSSKDQGRSCRVLGTQQPHLVKHSRTVAIALANLIRLGKRGQVRTMKTPSTAALAVLASLCLKETAALSDKGTSKAKYQEACPAYEHYSKYPQ